MYVHTHRYIYIYIPFCPCIPQVKSPQKACNFVSTSPYLKPSFQSGFTLSFFSRGARKLHPAFTNFQVIPPRTRTSLYGIDNVFALRPSLHTPHPPIWGGGGKGEGERRRRGFHHKNVAISVETWQGTGGLDPLHLSRPFREIRVPTAHLPIFCKLQSYTIINECSLLFQRLINIGQHIMKKNTNITWAFAIFRDPACPFAGQLPD